MAGRDGKKQARSAKGGRRLLVGMGASAGVFFAAAAMATGSAATAKADFEDLLDPIIQPILTSLTASIGPFDTAAAVDPAAAVAAAASPAADPAAVSTVSIPITIAEDTEPTVGATVGGASTTLLVDSGSSGLVVPLTDLDGGSTNFLTELDTLFSLGSPASFGEGGYSGGVDYIYLTYDNVDFVHCRG